jgi:hypothetical protein
MEAYFYLGGCLLSDHGDRRMAISTTPHKKNSRLVHHDKCAEISSFTTQAILYDGIASSQKLSAVDESSINRLEQKYEQKNDNPQSAILYGKCSL